ncbi:MAG: hypothetical protein RIQ60_80 [Pseudomonadota bacterium]
MDKSPSLKPSATDHDASAATPPDLWAQMINGDYSLARVWSEWAEAGHLWMSWWLNSLPTMPWPPAGMVLPPSLPERPLQAQSDSPTATLASGLPTPVLGKSSPRNRSASARHH